MQLTTTGSRLLLIAVSTLAIMATAVHAQVVGVTDISATHANGIIYPGAINSNGHPSALAQSFTTDNSAAQFSLTSVSLMLYQGAGTINDFTVTVRSNSGSNVPGSLLGTLTGNASPSALSTGTQYSYVTGSSLLLSPNTTYWVTWGFTSPADPTGLAIFFGSPVADTSTTGQWSLGANKSSFDGGVTWPSPANASFPLQVSIQATAIPEPGTYAAMFGAAVLGFAAWRRRRVV